MESEKQLKARYLACIRCGESMTREQPSDAFYSCSGKDKHEHPEVLVAAVFDTQEGILPRFVEPKKTIA